MTRTTMRGSVTPQQYRALRLMSEGKEMREIAEAMGITYETVRSHLKYAYERLGARDGAHAVRLCYERGIFRLPTTDHEETRN
ncbi:helix-turn-helix transcriptional regulator [Amycolatopsis sp. NPDC006131]|uniref:response regulator transcription factor n=1 Tax=Amycolatopsis sp. NPDC006131 TaxID=3156731 RepID=UPI0033BE6702